MFWENLKNTYPPDGVAVALDSDHYSLGNISCGDFSELSVTVEGAQGIQGMDPLAVGLAGVVGDGQQRLHGGVE